MPLNEIQKQVYDGLFKIAVANDYTQASITPHVDGYVLNYRTKDHTLAALPVYMSKEDGKAIIQHLLFEGRILFHGTSEELAANPVVRKNYLSENFVYRKFKPNEEDEAYER